MYFIDDQVEPVLFPHSITALTVIKDIVTCLNSTYYMLKRSNKLKPFIKEVCKEFNMHPVPTEKQWMSANKLVMHFYKRDMIMYVF